MSSTKMELDGNGNVPTEALEKDTMKTEHVVPAPYRYTKSIALFVYLVCLGMSVKFTGSSMFDLLDRVNSNYEGISQSISAMYIARIIGCLTGGYLVDKFPRHDDLIMSLILLLYSGSIFMKPWAGMVEILGLSYAAQGFATGGINAVMYHMALQLWGKKFDSFLMAIFMGAAGGVTIAPLITEPFLGSITRGEQNDTGSHAVTSHPYGTNQTNVEFMTSRIEIPFSIVSGTIFITSVTFAVLYYLKPNIMSTNTKRKKTSLRQLFNPNSCAAGKPVYGVSMCICLVLYCFCVKSTEEPMMTYLFTYAVKSNLQFSKQEAALLDSMQGLGQTLGRCLSSILGVWVPIRYWFLPFLLCTNVMLGLDCVFGPQSKIFLWVFTVAFSFCYGPVYPAGIAFTERYIEMSGIACSLPDIGVALGGFVSQLIVGVLLENYDSVYVLYFSLVAASASTTVMIGMYATGCMNGDRYERAKLRMREGEVNFYVTEIAIVGEPCNDDVISVK